MGPRSHHKPSLIYHSTSLWMSRQSIHRLRNLHCRVIITLHRHTSATWPGSVAHLYDTFSKASFVPPTDYQQNPAQITVTTFGFLIQHDLRISFSRCFWTIYVMSCLSCIQYTPDGCSATVLGLHKALIDGNWAGVNSCQG